MDESPQFHVLVVDDDRALADALALFLETPSVPVTCAYTVSHARAIILRSDMDLVLTDMCMTGDGDRDGLTLLDWIKTVQPRIPVVVMSGYGSTETEKLARGYGGLRFFHKPLAPEILRDLVVNLRRKKDPAAGAPEAGNDGQGTAPVPPPPYPLDDATLARTHREYMTGDEAALDRILEGCKPLIRSVCRSWYGLSPEEAQDISQEVCIEIMIKISRIRRLRPFAIGTTMNLCKSRIRSRVRERTLGAEAETLAETAAPPPPALGSALLHPALEAMEERDRTLLHMLFMENRTYTEVARRLDIPIGSIGPYRARALMKLKHVLGGFPPE
jgi:RNA polymerase sigma factor (sigma-70 family)